MRGNDIIEEIRKRELDYDIDLTDWVQAVDEEMKEEVRRAAGTIFRFNWSASSKGWHYWLNVFEELERIAKTGEI